MDIDRSAGLTEGEYLGLFVFEGCQVLAVLNQAQTYGRARAAWVKPLGGSPGPSRALPAWWPTDPKTVEAFGLGDPAWREAAHWTWCPGTCARIHAEAADWVAYIPRAHDDVVGHGTAPSTELEVCDVVACTVTGDLLASVDDQRRLSSVGVGPRGVRYTYSAHVRAEGLLLPAAQGVAQVINRRRIALVAPLSASVRDIVYQMADPGRSPKSTP